MGCYACQPADYFGKEQTEAKLGFFQHGIHYQAATDELH
jgi:hypothetical protein